MPVQSQQNNVEAVRYFIDLGHEEEHFSHTHSIFTKIEILETGFPSRQIPVKNEKKNVTLTLFY